MLSETQLGEDDLLPNFSHGIKWNLIHFQVLCTEMHAHRTTE